jgi:hypothetical protein
MRGHEYQDAVSLEMARRVASLLEVSDEPLRIARANLANWMERNASAPFLMRCYSEWLAILEKPKHEIIAILVQQSDEGQRLRQNSPFAGVLPPHEVWEIKRQLRNESVQS